MLRLRLLPAAVCVALVALALTLGGCAGKKKTTVPPPSTGGGTPSDTVGTAPPPAPEEQPPPVTGEETSALQDVYFDYDSSELRDDAKAALSANGKWLLDHTSNNVQIEGHCDERGTIEYNLALGERRAASAKAFLASYGVGEARLSTISYGEEKPADPGHDEDAWAKNRRCHFVIQR